MQSTSLGLVARVLLLRQWNSAEISGAAKSGSQQRHPRHNHPRERGVETSVYESSKREVKSLCSGRVDDPQQLRDEEARARLADGPLGPATASIDPAMGDGA